MNKELIERIKRLKKYLNNASIKKDEKDYLRRVLDNLEFMCRISPFKLEEW